MNFKKQVFLIFLLISCFSWQGVKATPLQTQTKPAALSSVKLISPLQSISKDTKKILIGVYVYLSKGWHSYWQFAGDSGKPLQIKWDVPHAIRISPLKWPIPIRQKVHLNGAPELINFIYKKSFLLIGELSWKDLESQKDYFQNAVSFLQISARVKWLICKQVCIPFSQNLSLKIPFTEKEKVHPLRQKIFNTWMNKMILPAPKVLPIQQVEGGYIIKGLHRFGPVLDLFPISAGVFSLEDPVSRLMDTEEQVLFVKKSKKFDPDASPAGVIVFNSSNEGAKPAAYLFQFKTEKNIFWFLLLAFLGGILLNFMPCVLPIVFLKLADISFAPQRVWKVALLYSTGVVSAFLALAGVIVALKAGGASIGWGFQMQSAYFLLSLILLFTLLSLNFIGFFPIALPSLPFFRYKGASSLKHFLTGILSVSAASPCTAPFMGAAIGYALSSAIWKIWAIFFSLGAGLAFPYLTLAIFPYWRRFIPSPGVWSEKLKQFMAFPMLASVAWLISLLNAIHPDSMLAILMSLVFLSMGFWLISFVQKKRFLIILVIIGLLIYPFYVLKDSQASISSLNWKNFSIQKMQETKGPLLISFSANWCLTCHFNEWITFKNKKVIETIHQNKIQLLKGDWTNKNPEITEVLNQYGRLGIPFYLYFPLKGQPRVLPELLTPTIFLNAIRE